MLWVKLVCGMPLWLYFVAMAIPGNGIAADPLLRRASGAAWSPPSASRIVEGSWILGPLFLFNNLHALHHETPTIPWYQYNARYRVIRERLLAENGGLVYYDATSRWRGASCSAPRRAAASRRGRVPERAPRLTEAIASGRRS